MFLFAGCGANERYVSYYDNKQNQLKSEGYLNNGIQDGKWQYYDTAGNVYQNGEYFEGMRKGIWNYHRSDITYDIWWTTFRTTEGILINTPENFHLIDTLSSAGIYSFCPDSSCLLQIESTTSFSIDSALTLLKQSICPLYNVVWSDFEQIITDDGSLGNYIRLRVVGEKFDGYIYLFLGKIGERVLIFKYWHLPDRLDYHNSVFNGVVDHCKIDNSYMLSPLSNTTTLNLQWECY